jgi:hypothetical protein
MIESSMVIHNLYDIIVELCYQWICTFAGNEVFSPFHRGELCILSDEKVA